MFFWAVLDHGWSCFAVWVCLKESKGGFQFGVMFCILEMSCLWIGGELFFVFWMFLVLWLLCVYWNWKGSVCLVFRFFGSGGL